MSDQEYASLIKTADRLWSAARRLDELRGDTHASEWVADKVSVLWRSGRAHDESELFPLIDVLEGVLRAEEEALDRIGEWAESHDDEEPRLDNQGSDCWGVVGQEAGGSRNVG